MTCMCFVVIGERAVKWILPRSKSYREIIAPMGGVWIIKTAVVLCPLFIPGTGAIRNEIMSTWLFTDPKNCCDDVRFPWIPRRKPRGGRFSDDEFFFFSGCFELRSKGLIKYDEDGAIDAGK